LFSPKIYKHSVKKKYDYSVIVYYFISTHHIKMSHRPPISEHALITPPIEISNEKRGSPQRWLQAIMAHATTIKLSRGDVAKRLGISLSYLNALLSSSDIQPKTVTMDKIRASAKFLGISPLAATLLAGQVQPEDVMWVPTSEEAVESFYVNMTEDLNYGIYMPIREEWDALSFGTKCGIILLYNEARANHTREVIGAVLDQLRKVEEVSKP
jgi:transcriptional regulator with XRE-family HTH domain